MKQIPESYYFPFPFPYTFLKERRLKQPTNQPKNFKRKQKITSKIMTIIPEYELSRQELHFPNQLIGFQLDSGLNECWGNKSLKFLSTVSFLLRFCCGRNLAFWQYAQVGFSQMPHSDVAEYAPMTPKLLNCQNYI